MSIYRNTYALTIGLNLLLVFAHAHQLLAQHHEHASDSVDITESDPQAAKQLESRLIHAARQLTFEGRRAGEGYFNRDGSQMVFQSEREPGNPFFQIYLLDLSNGDIERVSPGHGKTTCAWIHPDGDQVLFASTQGDPEAKAKQEEELKQRESGEQRRYSWDYDEQFDLYRFDRNQQSYKNLTSTRGYDAEGSWSPDGRLIAFASNRLAYSKQLTAVEQERFELDPSALIDLFVMDADGSNVRQLTDVIGYDGGPFFSPDGQRLCWRRFSPDGATAEIMSMKIDGSDVQPLTNLGAMSWAPFYHPSGRYLIFTTNLHGFGNFELYLVDADGKRKPVRVTATPGFDGLPVFSPGGDKLSWTTNRTVGKRSQIFMADWDHEAALALLGISELETAAEPALAVDSATQSAQRTRPDCDPRDILRHVDYLCRPELQGRRTGTKGEILATAYAAAFMEQLGLEPAGDDGSWFQPFQFTSGVNLGPNNSLTSGAKSYEVGTDWVPLAFSTTGKIGVAPVVFAGYGIAAPESDGQEEYDSFVHLDVKDKWVLAFRYMPEEISPERRQHLARHASIRFKTMIAREKGARGLIVVSGPNSGVKDELVRLRFDGSMSGSGLPVVSISNELAEAWLKESGKSLQKLQDGLDQGELAMGFELKDRLLAALIDIEQVERSGRNVLGRLRAAEEPTEQIVIIGAHIDHLGVGPNSSSLARDDERQSVHWGADDNASGVAAMLEVAEWLSSMKEQGKLALKRDILFAAWSGEEEGLLGANHFVQNFSLNNHSPHGSEVTLSLYPSIAACLNMDMVGRMTDKVILQGVGSSSVWPSEIERRNVALGLPVAIQNDSFIPTDASAFFIQGVPILSAFTGSHEDYHTPRDTPDKLNYDGAAAIAKFMALLTRSVAMREQAPDYIAQAKPKQTRARLRAYLGTIPDYATSDVKGLKLSGVAQKGPAAVAGVRSGDVIIELAGRKIENIYDYTYAIEALKIGQPTKVTVDRNGKRITLEITPGSRE